MNYLFLFCFLFVAAFASKHHKMPRPPCTWSLRWDVSTGGTPAGYRLQQVNGYFMRTTSENKNENSFTDELFRSDLGDPESSSSSASGSRKSIKVFTCSTKEGNSSSVKDYLDVRDSYKMINPLDGIVDIVFDYATPDTYYGKECLKYYDVYAKDFYYIDSDGYPIGMRSKDGSIEANATFSREAPSLDVFKFDKSYAFDDERVYTAPTESTCPNIFYMPELPCAWSYKWDMKFPEYASSDFQSQEINGFFARIWWSEEGGGMKEGIYRSDCAFNESGVEYFKEFYYNHGGMAAIYHENYYYARDYKYLPMLFYEDPMSAEYDSVEDEDYYGKPCKKYHDVYTGMYFYVDDSGFPIGFRNRDGKGEEGNGTFSREAPPLSVFTFDRSIHFGDERIYTPPNETICPEPSQHSEPSSSSSSKTSSKTSSTSPKTSSTSSTSPKTSSTSSTSPKTSSASSKTSSISPKTSSTASKTSSAPVALGSMQTVSLVMFVLTMIIFFILH